MLNHIHQSAITALYNIFLKKSWSISSRRAGWDGFDLGKNFFSWATNMTLWDIGPGDIDKVLFLTLSRLRHSQKTFLTWIPTIFKFFSYLEIISRIFYPENISNLGQKLLEFILNMKRFSKFDRKQKPGDNDKSSFLDFSAGWDSAALEKSSLTLSPRSSALCSTFLRFFFSRLSTGSGSLSHFWWSTTLEKIYVIGA